MNLPQFAINKPVTMAMILVGLTVFGLVSFGYIPLEFLPNLEEPQVSIFVPYQSSTPSEVEHNITIPLEEALSTVTGIKSIKGSSRENSSRIVLEYEIGTDLDLAMVEIRDRVDRARPRLPRDVRQVIIQRFSYDQIPVMWLTVMGEMSEDDLSYKINEILQKRLERLEGVATVDVYGILRKQIEIDLRLSALRAYNVNLYQVFSNLRSNNTNLSAGYVVDSGSKYFIRSVGEISSVEEVGNLPIGNSGLRLRDIATIRYDFPERNYFSRLNGQPAVSIVVTKTSSGNVVNVANAIRDVIENMDHDPALKGLKAYPVFDSSEMVIQNLDMLRSAGLIGAFFVIFVLFVFLRKMRSLFIVIMAIPLSVVISFATFYLLNTFFGLGFSINVISLIGMILSIGMLVDNSVVVLESIFRNKEEGLSAKLAALKGSSEVVMAVFAATLTTVAVFMTIIFDSNSRLGIWMRDFGIAIAVMLFSSLFVALTLVPLASSKLYSKFEAGQDRFNRYFGRLYGGTLKRFVKYRWVVVFVTVLLLLYALQQYKGLQIQMNFGGASRQINIGVEFAKGLSQKERLEGVAKMEQLLLKDKERLEIKAVVSRGGRLSGSLYVFLTAEKDAKKKTTEIQQEVAKITPSIPGIVFKTLGAYGRGGMRLQLTLRLKGPDQKVLERIGKELEQRYSYMWGDKNVKFNLESGDERVVVNLNRIRANQYGLTPQIVGYNIFSAFAERPVTYFRAEDREVPVILRLSEEDRKGVGSLKKMGLPTASGFVPLETIAKFETVKGAASYEREDKDGVATISIASKDFQQLFMYAGVISKQMKKYALPAGYSWAFGEQWFSWFKEEDSSNFAVIFAIIMIYIIMVALFESFMHPFTIMTSIPFAFIGTYILMRHTGTQIDSMTRLGFLVLLGIVVNNAIVLIDYINKLRKRGVARNEAIIMGGKHRLRPIIITAMTTVLALLPVAAPKLFPALVKGSSNPQTAQWAPMALVIIGGLVSSTFLTLLVTPCLYAIVDDFKKMVKRIFVRV